MYLIWPHVLTPAVGAVVQWVDVRNRWRGTHAHLFSVRITNSRYKATVQTLFKGFIVFTSFLFDRCFFTHLKTSLKHYLSSLCQTSLKHCLSSLCQTSLKHYLSSLCQTSLLISAESLNRNRIFCYLQTCVGFCCMKNWWSSTIIRLFISASDVFLNVV